MKKGNVNIEIKLGDIANQPDITAIVNAANAELQFGGGVAGAIHSAAGPGLSKECRKYAPISPGEAVITSAHELPNKYVIHCLGPIYGIDKPEDELLAACYHNAINLAEEYKIDSIAFPAISTGAFGYPIEAATEVVMNVIREEYPKITYLQTLRFVVFSEEDMQIYHQKLSLLED